MVQLYDVLRARSESIQHIVIECIQLWARHTCSCRNHRSLLISIGLYAWGMTLLQSLESRVGPEESQTSQLSRTQAMNRNEQFCETMLQVFLKVVGEGW